MAAELVDPRDLPLVVLLLRAPQRVVDLARDGVLKLRSDEVLDLGGRHALEAREHAERVAVPHHAAHRAREHLRAVGRPAHNLRLLARRELAHRAHRLAGRAVAAALGDARQRAPETGGASRWGCTASSSAMPACEIRVRRRSTAVTLRSGTRAPSAPRTATRSGEEERRLVERELGDGGVDLAAALVRIETLAEVGPLVRVDALRGS